MAERAVAKFALPVDIDPTEALLAEVQRAAGAVAWFQREVDALEPDEMIFGVSKETLNKENKVIERVRVAGANTWLKMLAEWSDRLTRVAKAAIDAGVSERLVKLEEKKGEILAGLMVDLITDERIGLTSDQQAQARKVAAQLLRAVPAE